MSNRTERVRDGICLLSAKTNVLDCPRIVRKFLKQVGHREAKIGNRTVFVVRRKNRTVRVASTIAGLNEQVSPLGATRIGRVDSI